MTANEQALQFLEELEKTSSGSAPGLEDFQISYALSWGQEEFIKTNYSYKSNDKQEGFEQSEKRRKDLAQLVTGTVIYSTDINNDSFFHSVVNKPNGDFWFLPEDLLWAINEEIVWVTTGCYEDLRIEVLPTTHDEYNTKVRNSFTKPHEELVFRLDYSSEFSVNDTNAFKLKALPFITTVSGTYAIEINTDSEGVFSVVLNLSTPFTWLDVLNAFADDINNNYPKLTAEVDVVNVTLKVFGEKGDTVFLNSITDPTNTLEEVNTIYPVHELITHGWDIKEYHLRYIRQPKDIVVDFETTANQVNCELNPSTHREIISIAVRNTMAALADPRYQLAVNEEKKQE